MREMRGDKRRLYIIPATLLLTALLWLVTQVIPVQAGGGDPVQISVGAYVIDGEDHNNQGITFDKETCTLTLNNVNLESKRYFNNGKMFTLLSATKKTEAGKDLTIQLIGDNTMSYADPVGEVQHSQPAIVFTGFSSVTFTGGGSLNIKCGGNNDAGIEFFRTSQDLYEDKLIIDGCTINIDASDCLGLAQENLKGRFAGIDNVGDAVLNNASLNISAQGNNAITDFYGVRQRGYKVSGAQRIDIKNSTVTIADTPGSAEYAKGFLVYDGIVRVENSKVDIDVTGSQKGYAFQFWNMLNPPLTGTRELSVFYSEIAMQTPHNNYSRVLEGGLTELGQSIYQAGDTMDTLEEKELSEVIIGEPSIEYCPYSALKIMPDGDAPEVTIGDINGDGNINLVDLMQCLNHVGGKEFLEGDALKAADINEDGTVNLVDLMRLLNYVGGKSETL